MFRPKVNTDKNQQPIINKLRGYGASVYSTASIGRGFPDLCVGYMGRNYLMEVKNPERDGKLNERQEQFFERWKGSAHVVYYPEDAIKILRDEYESARAELSWQMTRWSMTVPRMMAVWRALGGTDETFTHLALRDLMYQYGEMTSLSEMTREQVAYLELTMPDWLATEIKPTYQQMTHAVRVGDSVGKEDGDVWGGVSFTKVPHNDDPTPCPRCPDGEGRNGGLCVMCVGETQADAMA